MSHHHQHHHHPEQKGHFTLELFLRCIEDSFQTCGIGDPVPCGGRRRSTVRAPWRWKGETASEETASFCTTEGHQMRNFCEKCGAKLTAKSGWKCNCAMTGTGTNTKSQGSRKCHRKHRWCTCHDDSTWQDRSKNMRPEIQPALSVREPFAALNSKAPILSLDAAVHRNSCSQPLALRCDSFSHAFHQISASPIASYLSTQERLSRALFICCAKRTRRKSDGMKMRSCAL